MVEGCSTGYVISIYMETQAEERLTRQENAAEDSTEANSSVSEYTNSSSAETTDTG